MAYKDQPVSKNFTNGLEFELSFCPVNSQYKLSIGFPQYLVTGKASGIHFAEQLSLIQHQGSCISDCLLALAQAVTELEAGNDQGVAGEGEEDTA